MPDERTVLTVACDEALTALVSRSVPGYCVVRASATLEGAARDMAALSPALVIADPSVLTDAATPEGRTVMDVAREAALPPKVIVVSDCDDREKAAEAIGLGVFDYYVRPIRPDEFAVFLRRALHIRELEAGIEDLPARLAGVERFENLVGGCEAMRAVFTAAQRVAETDAGVLLVGESGTGKRLIARAIHHLSSRNGGPFVTVNASAVPPDMIDAEVFGRAAGGNGEPAPASPGKLEEASGGTLLLDGVCELPLPLQTRLSVFLRDGETRRTGSTEVLRPDVRLIAATDHMIGCGQGAGALSEDLYYRLGVITVTLPPLRERGEDIAALARMFLTRYASEHGRAVAGYARSAMAAMMSHVWPGNIAELETRVRRAVILSRGRLLTSADLGLNGNGRTGDLTLVEARNELERTMVNDALLQAAGNVSRAARAIGVSRPTMYDLIRKYDLNVSEYKGLNGTGGGSA